MQLCLRREGAKIREDLLKCKYVPPASGSPDYLLQRRISGSVNLYLLRWAEGLRVGFW